MAKTQKEIDVEIKALKAVRPNVRPRSMFGDDNLGGVDAQIQVLEEDLDDDDIYDEFDRTSSSEYILEAAIGAREWIDDKEDSDWEGLACEWPLLKE